MGASQARRELQTGGSGVSRALGWVVQDGGRGKARRGSVLSTEGEASSGPPPRPHLPPEEAGELGDLCARPQVQGPRRGADG